MANKKSKSMMRNGNFSVYCRIETESVQNRIYCPSMFEPSYGVVCKCDAKRCQR